jgi:hypothetical protein
VGVLDDAIYFKCCIHKCMNILFFLGKESRNIGQIEEWVLLTSAFRAMVKEH